MPALMTYIIIRITKCALRKKRRLMLLASIAIKMLFVSYCGSQMRNLSRHAHDTPRANKLSTLTHASHYIAKMIMNPVNLFRRETNSTS